MKEFTKQNLAGCAAAVVATWLPFHATASDRALQLRLMQEGFYRGPIDGMFGTGSRRALMEYAADRGITGDIDDAIPALFEEAREAREEVTEGQRRATESEMASELLDGDTAIVRYDFSYPIDGIPIISPAIGHQVVCGEVNARNAYGAYTGFQPFNLLLTDYGDDRYIGRLIDFGEFAQASCYLGTHFALGAADN